MSTIRKFIRRLSAVKIWIDALTPKQVNLFSVFVKQLRRGGHEVDVTTRRYREANALLKIRGIRATAVGRHGGPGLAAKLSESAKRIAALTSHVTASKPDLALSFCSPEAARVAYGLKIPNYAMSDSPHAQAVCRLTLPLTKTLFTPKAVPKVAWTNYGISRDSIFQYDALDPVAWIRTYHQAPNPCQALRPRSGKPLVVLRPPEEFAAYLLGRKSAVAEVGRRLGRENIPFVVLPRYREQLAEFRREFGPTAKVLPGVVDGISLLSRASVFVGAGGTMTAEAALLGVPAISCYPSSPTYVDRYLFRLGLAERLTSPVAITRRINELLDSPTLVRRRRLRAANLLAKMDDPVAFVLRQLDLK